jgi:hypothetical protein
LSEGSISRNRALVPPVEIRIEGVGVNALDHRRVDVAVDLTPCLKPVTIEMVIVGPDDDEASCVLLIDNREWMVDKIMHLRQAAQAGEYTLHVGVFYEEELVTRTARRFTFPLAELGASHG